MSGEADNDGRSDVFALGAVLYEMLAGAPPWTKQEYLQMAVGVRERRPRPLMRDIPTALETLIVRCLSWEPEDRPTAAELSAELDRIAPSLDDRPAPCPSTEPNDAEATQFAGKVRA